ncbi:MAG: UvrABC system protein C [Alphaproteobacteria bacterium MarineAlpha5_Bin11]|nr:MAG: UvrABC system protein C [Alphaproteobacteria bacterium MarineAlpha5_Bin11]PPR51964.1 MAG: UvrABC system protein C [Alphaproteobacteria bacterium MarineAlpha5_Bin10]|tara:strand:- start:9127 stop:11040 length:1914 start_codon:yes stop_codon:yes gene_type:complete
MAKEKKYINSGFVKNGQNNKNTNYSGNLSGIEIIRFIAKKLPAKPGIYQMENNDGEILYIGKAKNLAKRVVNYSNISNLTRRLQRMVFQTKNVNFTLTNTETEALLLECSLIKRYRPKYNIILRDDKSFPYILINKEHKFARIQKYRGPKKIKGNYYGPFVSPSIADSTLLSLQKTFLLRSCSDGTFSNRSRPCLLYDIKRCSAPCVKKITENEYNENIIDAKKFLSGNSKNVKKKLIRLMNIASSTQAYEESARIRDRIKSLDQIQKYQFVYIKDLRNTDIFSIKIIDGKSCIFGMFYRNGSNYGNKAFYPYHSENSEAEEVLESFLFQFYSNMEPPHRIIINLKRNYFKNFEDIMSKKSGKKILVINPKIGEKHKHIQLAEKNALESLKRRNINLESHYRSLNSLRSILKLKEFPKRIEAFDNSHIFGKFSLGVMIVVNQEGFENRSYRKFNIKYDKLNIKHSKSNDYYMLEEVLTRRLKRVNSQEDSICPEIIIIDGGKGHLSIAKKIINKFKLNIGLIAIAKGKDRNSGRDIIFYNDKTKVLDKREDVSNFIQIIRDESHRFAIYSHRKKRGKEMVKSVFDDMTGIGPKRKNILLNHFGTVKNMSNAKVEEFYNIKGINKNLADYIYGFFNSH